MTKKTTIENIKQLGTLVIPQGGHLWLYGSRARGDFHEESDWDLLILLDKDQQSWDDFGTYGYPFVEMGIELGEKINPMIYTKQEWAQRSFTPFFHNVEHDKITLI